LRGKFYREILTVNPERGRQAREGWGKQAIFYFKRQYLETVGDTPKVTINDVYAISIYTEIDDLG